MVNPATNENHVADNGSEDLTIINGDEFDDQGGLENPRAVAVNQYSNKIYVVNYTSNNVSIVDGDQPRHQRQRGSVSLGAVLNAMRDEIDVTTVGMNSHHHQHIYSVSRSLQPLLRQASYVYPTTNKAYVSNFIYDGAVTMIDGSNDSTGSVLVGNYPDCGRRQFAVAPGRTW